jgi:hypothetical protein
MRCNIIWTDPSNGNEILESIRDSDEIIEHEGMTEKEAARFENEIKKVGRFHLSSERCVWRNSSS